MFRRACLFSFGMEEAQLEEMFGTMLVLPQA